ncbi:MAG: bifunctional hydroxymethylpyrimidine kinase/phosphomethylpyrimidine kinase [Desulfurococcaceae archaeon]
MRRVPVAMSIAGSDSGGGAGIQADLKTFSALGVYGTIAITSITSQNTREVTAVHDLPGRFVYEQIRTVVEDIGVDAAKTGMLSNTDIIKYVASAIREFKIPLVVDPVMVAKSGAKLLRNDAVEALVTELIPCALVVTPNAVEAAALSGMSVSSIEDAEKVARVIAEKYGPKSVVVKGGHLGHDRAVDVLYYKGSLYHFESSRLEGCFHGGGCSYAAAIAGYIAKGLDVVDAVGKAKEFIVYAIRHGVRIGKGHCPVNPMAWVEIPAEKYRTLESVKQAVNLLMENNLRLLSYIPEAGLNIVEAIDVRYALGLEDVAGVKGRVVRVGEKLTPAGPIEFGLSNNLSRLVLEVMKYKPDYRAAASIKYSKNLVDRAIEMGYSAISIGGGLEDLGLSENQKISSSLIIKEILQRHGEIPDIIYHTGEIGTESMLIVIGRNAVEAINKLLRVVP